MIFDIKFSGNAVDEFKHIVEILKSYEEALSPSLFNSSPTEENLRKMFALSKIKYGEMENALNVLYSKLDSEPLSNRLNKLDATLNAETLDRSANASNSITRMKAECQNAEVKLAALGLLMEMVKGCEGRLLDGHDKGARAKELMQHTLTFYIKLARLPSEHRGECHVESLLKALSNELDQYCKTLSLEVYKLIE